MRFRVIKMEVLAGGGQGYDGRRMIFFQMDIETAGAVTNVGGAGIDGNDFG